MQDVAVRSRARAGLMVAVFVAMCLTVGSFPGSAAASSACGGRTATIVGTSGADTLRGTDGRDVIAGLGGDDVIYGLGDKDFICGNGGEDRLYGGGWGDVIFGGDGADVIKGGLAGDRLRGDAGGDVVVGGRGYDTLYGGNGNDALWGLLGDDFLVGDDGDDRLYGGDGGNDGLQVAPEDTGTDALDGGAGRDELLLTGCADGTGTSSVDLTTGAYATPSGQGTVTGIADVRGSACDDTIIGDAQANRLAGEGGNDSLDGGDGSDLIEINGGRSIIERRDYTNEGSGTRRVSGTFAGGAGADDVVIRFVDSDVPQPLDVRGGPGTDTLTFLDRSGGHEGTYEGPVDVDLQAQTFLVRSLRWSSNAMEGAVALVENVNATSHADVIVGDGAGNKLVGGFGDDRIFGRGGDDDLRGDSGPDVGADELWGEAGVDTVNGAGDATGPTYTERPDICAGEMVSRCEDVRQDTQAGAE